MVKIVRIYDRMWNSPVCSCCTGTWSLGSVPSRGFFAAVCMPSGRAAVFEFRKIKGNLPRTWYLKFAVDLTISRQLRLYGDLQQGPRFPTACVDRSLPTDYLFECCPSHWLLSGRRIRSAFFKVWSANAKGFTRLSVSSRCRPSIEMKSGTTRFGLDSWKFGSAVKCVHVVSIYWVTWRTGRTDILPL